MNLTEEQVSNFAVKISKQGHDECWEWQGSRHPQGYGQVRINHGLFLSHRVAWELFFGEIPEGKLVLHKCNNPSCVNPYHLYLGDHSDNTSDMIRNGTHRANSPRLYDEEIWLIRRLLHHSVKQPLIAKMFKVDRSVISRINTRSDYPSRGSINNSQQGDLKDD